MGATKLGVFPAGVVIVLMLAGSASGQGAIPVGPRRAEADPGVDAMRREVGARDREQEMMFAKMRALGPPKFEDLRAPVRLNDEQVRLLVAFPDTVRVDNTFNALLFGSWGVASMRARLDGDLNLKVHEAAERSGLSRAQEARLRLAGQGDVKRLFDDIEASRKVFNVAWTQGEQRADLLKSLGPLRIRLQNPWSGEVSLFSKTLRKLENEQQAAGRRAIER